MLPCLCAHRSQYVKEAAARAVTVKPPQLCLRAVPAQSSPYELPAAEGFAGLCRLSPPRCDTVQKCRTSKASVGVAKQSKRGTTGAEDLSHTASNRTTCWISQRSLLLLVCSCKLQVMSRVLRVLSTKQEDLPDCKQFPQIPSVWVSGRTAPSHFEPVHAP